MSPTPSTKKVMDELYSELHRHPLVVDLHEEYSKAKVVLSNGHCFDIKYIVNKNWDYQLFISWNLDGINKESNVDNAYDLIVRDIENDNSLLKAAKTLVSDGIARKYDISKVLINGSKFSRVSVYGYPHKHETIRVDMFDRCFADESSTVSQSDESLTCTRVRTYIDHSGEERVSTFSPQTKGILSEEEIYPMIKDMIHEYSDEFSYASLLFRIINSTDYTGRSTVSFIERIRRGYLVTLSDGNTVVFTESGCDEGAPIIPGSVDLRDICMRDGSGVKGVVKTFERHLDKNKIGSM